MSTLQERVQQYMAETGDTVAMLAAKSGKSSSAVSQWLSGKVKSIHFDTAANLAKNTGYLADWWATGKAPPTAPPSAASVASENVGAYGGKAILALAGEDTLPAGSVLIKESSVRFSAGPGYEATFEEIEDSDPVMYQLSWFQSIGVNWAQCRRFRVHGDSMERTLFDKDSILVHIRPNLRAEDIVQGKVYALRYKGEQRVKRLFSQMDGTLTLHSDNETYVPQDEIISPEMAAEHITIIGRVIDKSGSGGL